MDRNEVLKHLRVIPGVGASLAEDLYELGIRNVSDLVGKILKTCIKDSVFFKESKLIDVFYIRSVVQCILHQLPILILKNLLGGTGKIKS